MATPKTEAEKSGTNQTIRGEWTRNMEDKGRGTQWQHGGTPAETQTWDEAWDESQEKCISNALEMQPTKDIT